MFCWRYNTALPVVWGLSVLCLARRLVLLLHVEKNMAYGSVVKQP